MDRETKIELRNVLSNLYPTIEDSRRVVEDARINSSLIAYNSKAIINWNEIIRVAENFDKIFDIIEVALEDIPGHPLLKEIKEKGKVVPTPAPVIDKDISWLSTTPANTLEKLMAKESTLLPISFLEVGLQRSRSVARVKLEEGSGTGLLTENNIFITNHHVIENVEQAKTAVIQFNYQNTAKGLDLEPVDFRLAPGNNGFLTSEEDDWTLVRVDGDANAAWGAIKLVPVTDYKKIQYVNIIQHPRGGPKQIALYHNIVAYADEKRLQYLTDTLEGSSGSPVFDNKWRVVALHHSGGNVIEPETKTPVFRNEGININMIVEALKQM